MRVCRRKHSVSASLAALRLSFACFRKTDINVTLRPTNGASVYKKSNEIHLPSPETLATFRALVRGAKLGTLTVTEQISSVSIMPLELLQSNPN